MCNVLYVKNVEDMIHWTTLIFQVRIMWQKNEDNKEYNYTKRSCNVIIYFCYNGKLFRKGLPIHLIMSINGPDHTNCDGLF